MLANYISFAAGELNSGTVVYKSITDREITTSSSLSDKRYYRPAKIKIRNNSGGQVKYGVFTAIEYSYYANSGVTICDLIPINDTETETLDGFKGEITKVCAQGTSGHTTIFEMIAMQE